MIDFKQFATPHSHPQSLDSASTPEAFAIRQKELGGVALTATDHGSLAASHAVYELGKKHGLIAIPGLEAYVRDDSCPILTKHGVQKTTAPPPRTDPDTWHRQYPTGNFMGYLKYLHLTLHALDYEGYLCMVRLLSRADARAEQHGSERKPLFSWSDIEEMAAHNITAGSSCLIGMTQRHLMVNRPEIAEDYFRRMLHLFGDRFLVEVFPHRCTHNWVKGVFLDVEVGGVKKTLRYYWGKKLRTNQNEEDGIEASSLADSYNPKKHLTLVSVKDFRKWAEMEPATILAIRKTEGFLENECVPLPDGSVTTDIQLIGNKFVLEMAKKYRVPVMTSDDSHFATSDDKVVQDVRLSQSGDWKFHESYHLQSSREAFLSFEQSLGTSEKEFEGWVENSISWAERFRGFKFDTTASLPTKFYPSDTLAHTKLLIDKHGRMNKVDLRYTARLKEEIQLLHRNGTVDLLPYFFLAEEAVGVYADAGMLTGAGRGSASGCLISYLLGITHVDPIRWGLSLDRFLTLDRIKSGKLPDIDIDFPSRQLLVGDE